MPFLRYIAVSLCLMAGGCAHVTSDNFFVPSSSLAEDWRHVSQEGEKSGKSPNPAGREFVVTGHRITAGEGTVLAIRRFNAGSPFLTDQASFEKLSISLPKSMTGEGDQFAFERTGSALAFYSSGSSNFPGGAGCFGYATDGHVRVIRRTTNSLVVHLDLHIPLTSPAGWKQDCTEKHIDQDMEFAVKPLDQLTPWDGRPGKHVYDETMRTN